VVSMSRGWTPRIRTVLKVLAKVWIGIPSAQQSGFAKLSSKTGDILWREM
jgi:hypothetical protein